MSPRAQNRLLNRLERAYGPAIRLAFERSVRDWRRQINVGDVTRMVSAGDLSGVMSAIGLSDAVYRDLEIEIARVFENAGRAFTSLFPKNVRGPDGLAVQFRFDMRHRMAEAFLRYEAAGLVTQMVADQRRSIQALLSEALGSGDAPRTTALRLVGTINRATGVREGGIIGLSDPQSQYLRNARRYLETGDRAYFDLTLRDRRFDGTIRRAMDAGQSAPAAAREAALRQYSNRMLRQRGETISATETLNAVRAGQHVSFVQGAEQAGLSENDVEREWDASADSRTRHTHAAADGQKVTGRDTTFVVGGYRMRYPGDGSMGAPAKETIRCRCIEIFRVDWIANASSRALAA